MTQVTYGAVLRAVDFIERRLDEPFSLDDVATAAGLSRYALHRLFRASVGENLKGYVRKRRLTAAAGGLRDSNAGVLELAVAAGFGSQEAFTRAFRAYFGATPGQYRRDLGARGQPGLLRAGPDAIRHRHHGVTHEPRLVERSESLLVRGFGGGAGFEDDAPIAALWQRLLRVLDVASGPPVGELVGVAAPTIAGVDTEPSQPLAYVAGVSGDASGAILRPPLLKGYLEVIVPAGSYAVFEHRGPMHHVIDTVNYAWATWLPQSGRRKSDRPDLEVVPPAALKTMGVAGPMPQTMQLWVSIDD